MLYEKAMHYRGNVDTELPLPPWPREAPEGVESILLEQVLMRPLLEERQPKPVLHKVVLIRRRSRLHRY